MYDIEGRTIISELEIMHAGSQRRPGTIPNGCLVCKISLGDSELVDHLKNESDCRSQYMSRMKVSSFHLLIAKLFICESCHIRRGQLKRHLLQAGQCLQFYSEKYNVDTVDAIMKKHNALKRTTYKSRDRESRAIENERINNVPLVKSLNDYRMKTAFSNYKLCCICNSNFYDTVVREIEDHESCISKLDWHCLKGVTEGWRNFQFAINVMEMLKMPLFLAGLIINQSLN